jgi:acyl carrier protein
MMKMEQFISWLEDILNVKHGMLNMETTKADVGTWDSLMHLRIVMEIEEEYDVEIPMDKINEINSVKDFWEYVKYE